MTKKKYDPADDPIVQKILAAKTERERKALEKGAVAQSDNGPKDADPDVKVSQAKKPRKS